MAPEKKCWGGGKNSQSADSEGNGQNFYGPFRLRETFFHWLTKEFTLKRRPLEIGYVNWP